MRWIHASWHRNFLFFHSIHGARYPPLWKTKNYGTIAANPLQAKEPTFMKRTTRFSALVCLMADDTDKNACGSEKNGLAYEKKKQHFTESHALKISCGILLSTSRWGERTLRRTRWEPDWLLRRPRKPSSFRNRTFRLRCSWGNCARICCIPARSC